MNFTNKEKEITHIIDALKIIGPRRAKEKLHTVDQISIVLKRNNIIIHKYDSTESDLDYYQDSSGLHEVKKDDDEKLEVFLNKLFLNRKALLQLISEEDDVTKLVDYAKHNWV